MATVNFKNDRRDVTRLGTHMDNIFMQFSRFHVTVADDLETSNENIIELRQPMSEKMDKIQHSIVECMDACLSDIKRGNSMVSFSLHLFLVIYAYRCA
jgi:hypothetical protein